MLATPRRNSSCGTLPPTRKPKKTRPVPVIDWAKRLSGVIQSFGRAFRGEA